MMPQHSLKSQFLSEFILAFLDVIWHLERINCLLQLILETMLPSLKLLQFIFLRLVVKMAVYTTHNSAVHLRSAKHFGIFIYLLTHYVKLA